MSEPLNASASTNLTLGGAAQAVEAAAQLAGPLATANGATDKTVAQVVNVASVVNSVVSTVAAHPDVPAHRVASVATSILQGLLEAEPAIFALTRSSAGTQAAVNTGATLAEILLGAFTHV